VCESAASLVRGLSTTLAQGRSHVEAQVALVGVEVWNGLAAQAFRDSAATSLTEAVAGVQAWDRLAATLSGYAAELTAVQVEADAVRTRLARAQDDLTYARGALTRATTAAAATDDDDASGTVDPRLRLAVGTAQGEIATAQALLDALGQRRRDLDRRTADALLDAPGPGARAWAALAYRADGSARPLATVLDEVLDRLLDGTITTEDHLLLARLLSMHSGDQAAMSLLYRELGAAGVTDLLVNLATVEDLHDDLPAGTTTAGLAAQIAAGLVTASRAWSPGTATAFGAALLDTITPHGRRPAVTFLLAAEGLDTDVVLGAFDHLEALRGTDPDRFAELTGTAAGTGPTVLGLNQHTVEATITTALGAGPGTLTGAIFAQMARDPEAVVDRFAGQDARTDYWFGQHAWGGDRFEGPATLLDAIAHDADLQAARASDPLGDTWREAIGVLAAASEALGGNLSFQVGALSPTAARDLAEALATVVPEIAAGLGSGVEFLDGEPPRVEVLGLGDATAFDVQRGNLSRLLGVTLLDPAALATFSGAAGQYASDVLTHVTGPHHPDVDSAKTLLDGVGSLFGLTHGSYTAQDTWHAEALSDQARRELDTVMTISSLIPGISTGHAVADYLAQVATSTALDHGAGLDPRIIGQQDLDALVDRGTGLGGDLLHETVDATLAARWDAITPAYTGTGDQSLGAPTLTSTLDDSYAATATAVTNPVATGDYDVRVPGETQHRNPRDMP
jgi:uncharacterized protein YukE